MCHDVRTVQPSTEKVHQIISRTAKFVSEHGGQSEIILRVKQGDNPTFGFLMPDHELHAYFRFLVDHPELSKGFTDSSDKQEEKKKSASVENELLVTGGALSLLGSIYGSGEDDGGIQDTLDFIETHNKNTEDVTCATLPCSSQISSSSLNEEARIAVKLPTAASEKPPPAKKGRSSGAIAAGAAKSKTKTASDGTGNLFINRLKANTSDHDTVVLEPPSSVKRMVDKTVEFIIKNGKEFEASLIEQDKTNEKFPFLRPTSQYHSYYLKVLQGSRESKLPRKNLSDHRHLSVQHVRNMEIKGTVSDGFLSNAMNTMNQFEGSYLLDRKEKFRMVIGGAKKEANNPSSKPAKPPGMSAEEAAAIVMGATRGLSSHTNSDTPPRTSVDYPDTMPKRIDGGRSSSLGDFSSLPAYNPTSKTTSDGKAGSSLPDGLSKGTGKPGKESCSTTGGVLVANAIAKTVAGEADSSDACLTKEQKLKAERLKRAKLFAAMVKSGKHQTTELSPGSVAHGSQVAAAGSVLSGRESDIAEQGRGGSSVPIDAEIGDFKEKPREKASMFDSKRERSPEQDESGLRLHSEDSEQEHRHSRKRHHSRHSSHSSRHDHRHRDHTKYRRKHHESSEDEYLQSSRDKHKRKRDVSSEDEHPHSNREKHKRKHHSSSKNKLQDSDEDEPLNRKKSESKHRRKRHGRCSDDENRGRKSSHRHHKKSHTEQDQNLENEGHAGTSNISKQVSLSLSNDIQEVSQPTISEAPSSIATEVPNDLRAKIRAMLLETM